MARTYFSKKVTVTAGYHIVTGFAEDSFVSIEETGDGVQSVAGAKNRHSAVEKRWVTANGRSVQSVNLKTRRT